MAHAKHAKEHLDVIPATPAKAAAPVQVPDQSGAAPAILAGSASSAVVTPAAQASAHRYSPVPFDKNQASTHVIAPGVFHQLNLSAQAGKPPSAPQSASSPKITL